MLINDFSSQGEPVFPAAIHAVSARIPATCNVLTNGGWRPAAALSDGCQLVNLLGPDLTLVAARHRPDVTHSPARFTLPMGTLHAKCTTTLLADAHIVVEHWLAKALFSHHRMSLSLFTIAQISGLSLDTAARINLIDISLSAAGAICVDGIWVSCPSLAASPQACATLPIATTDQITQLHDSGVLFNKRIRRTC